MPLGLDVTPNALSLEKKKKKLDFIKMKNFCFVKDTVKRIKRQATCWEKILENTYPIKNLNPECTKKS